MSTSRCLLLAGFFLTPLALIGQETRPNAGPTTRGQAQAQGQGQSQGSGQGQVHSEGRESGGMNKFIASCIKNGNQKEVTLSKLAEQKASDPDVKAFAQQMVKDHSEFLAKLGRAHQEGTATSGAAGTSRTEIRSETRTNTNRDSSGQNPASNRRSSGQDDDNSSDQAGTQSGQSTRTAQAGQRDATQPGARTDIRVDTTRGDVTVGAAGAGMSGHLDQIVRMENEIAQRCLASAQRELNEKQGKDFDKCYMFMQVGAHMEMADKLTVFRNHASGELQQLIDEGLQTTQQHLQHAKQLAQRIDEGGGAAGAATGVRRDASGANRGTSGANRDASGGTNVERRSGANTGNSDNDNSNNRRGDSNRAGAGTERGTSERQPNN